MNWKWLEKHVALVTLFIFATLSLFECHSSNSSLQSNLLIPREKFSCPVGCICKSAENVNCRGVGFRNISDFIHLHSVIKLDLSHNDISHLGPLALKDLPLLEDLDLSANKLTYIDTDALHHPRLKTLSLQSTHLNHIPSRLFSRLPNLQTLHLDLNDINQLDPSSLASLVSLRHLRLDNNQLNSIPKQALSHLHKLETLNLSFNKIREIPGKALENQTSLVVLILDYNEIETIDEEAFVGLSSLKILELRHNQIKQLPSQLQHLPLLYELYLSNNHITHIKAGIFQQVPRLSLLELRGNPLQTIDNGAFAFLPRLQKLILSEVKDLRQFPFLNGSISLDLIRIDRARIQSLPQDLCQFVPSLRSLDVKSNIIESLPDLSGCRNLRLLDVSHNKLTSLAEYSFRHLSHLHDLLLSHNNIQDIAKHAFTGLHKLKILDLSENHIESIHPEAFLPLNEVQDINLGYNFFPFFPSVGLENALHIKVHNNPNLREFPSPAAFPKVKSLALSYAYHCCPFQNPGEYGVSNGADDDNSPLKDEVIFPFANHDIDIQAWAKGETLWVDSNPLWRNISQQWANIASMANHANLSDMDIDKLLSSSTNIAGGPGMFLAASGSTVKKNPVLCIPEPSPFMPCQDLFDWWSLRCGVWLVFLMALLGNGAVVFVLIFARSKIDVPRFLVCNLAMADFFMGIYLGFLAVVDASTLGEFRMYAIPWQFSAGCQVAGFLGVLSSELSVYTLAVITMERNYAITHAMHLNKRLSLRHASYIMAVGWFFALIMAIMPLVGVSDYRKFAVCLPFEVGNSVSKGYVIFLMFINGVAFLILMGCYLKMYCAIRGSQAWNSNDSRIAKRMALLVFTDFLCWAPIAFFSLTAAFGIQFVSLEEAKVFTVFILPLNSCCNPFLYAILTKQFKKDCVLICKAIEESRVTRGIGRCRHSSNFSNRQTPGNTNSLGDRNSSKDGSSCQCQSRLLDKPKRNTPRWLPAPFRSFLRRIRAIETDMDSSSSANEYAYQIAEIQQKQQRKHRRAESVSSDNFSSSRSDSVKAVGCGLPMRIVGRRRNSWTVTRKPSSDSNLSSSRNDSSTSAMTASTSAGTAAWRTSRSSVSSDGGSSNYKGSLRDKDRFLGGSGKGNSSLTTALPDVHKRSSSIRDKSLRQLPTSPLAAGILRQQSVATPTGNFVQRTVISYGHQGNNPTATTTPPSITTTSTIGSKPKPRLTRQVAIQDDVYIPSSSKSVSFDANVLPNREDSLYCPLHANRKTLRLEGVWESSIEEDDENSPTRSNSSDKSDPHRYNHVQQALAIYTNRDRNRLGLVGFIPRKLSTISSRSCSMNPENMTEEVYLTSGPTSSYLSPVQTKGPQGERKCPETLRLPNGEWKEVKGRRRQQHLLSKSDNDLYCHARDVDQAHKTGSVAYLPSFLLSTPPCSSHVHSSLLMIDDEVFEENSKSIHPLTSNCPINAAETQPLI